ncbi:MAG TPA: hypothetical protein VHL78_04815 [Actinomycetota bacterium]|nr:hypothetical protein [Actinomycetota bacterium]
MNAKKTVTSLALGFALAIGGAACAEEEPPAVDPGVEEEAPADEEPANGTETFPPEPEPEERDEGVPPDPNEGEDGSE